MILPARCWDKLYIRNDSFGLMQSRRLIGCSIIKYMPVKDLYRIEIDGLDKIALTFVKNFILFSHLCVLTFGHCHCAGQHSCLCSQAGASPYVCLSDRDVTFESSNLDGKNDLHS